MVSIDYKTFYACNNLTNVTISNSIKAIDECAFYYCPNLTSINFNGTTAEWNAINKNYNWIIRRNYAFPDYPDTKIICSDGTVAL